MTSEQRPQGAHKSKQPTAVKVARSTRTAAEAHPKLPSGKRESLTEGTSIVWGGTTTTCSSAGSTIANISDTNRPGWGGRRRRRRGSPHLTFSSLDSCSDSTCPESVMTSVHEEEDATTNSGSIEKDAPFGGCDDRLMGLAAQLTFTPSEGNTSGGKSDVGVGWIEVPTGRTATDERQTTRRRRSSLVAEESGSADSDENDDGTRTKNLGMEEARREEMIKNQLLALDRMFATSRHLGGAEAKAKKNEERKLALGRMFDWSGVRPPSGAIEGEGATKYRSDLLPIKPEMNEREQMDKEEDREEVEKPLLHKSEEKLSLTTLFVWSGKPSLQKC